MHRGPSVCNAAEEQHGVAHQWATSPVAPGGKRRPPTGRSRSGATPHRERPAATLRACLLSRRTPVRRVFFERVAATLVGKPGAPERHRQRFQAAWQRLAMYLLNAQRNLPECHRFGAGRLDGSGDQGIRQRAGPPALMSGQQTTQAPVVPGMRPVVHRLVAHLALNGDLMNPPSAGTLQQTQPTGPKVLIRMLARQLLQGLLLRFSQFNGTFHGQAGGQDEIASQTRHSEIRLLDTLIGRGSCQIHALYSFALPSTVTSALVRSIHLPPLICTEPLASYDKLLTRMVRVFDDAPAGTGRGRVM